MVMIKQKVSQSKKELLYLIQDVFLFFYKENYKSKYD